MTGKSKSILLQVAAYISAGTGGATLDAASVQANYDTLLGLIESNGIDADDNGYRGEKKEAVRGVSFTFSGRAFEDFRALKSSEQVSPKHPDFVTADKQPLEGVTNERGAVWITDRQGGAILDFIPMVEAADAAAPIA